MFLKVISEKITFKDRFLIFFNNNTESVTLHIAKMSFDDYEDKNECRRVRMKAIYELFNRWTVAGCNKCKAKEPFGCKSFNEFFNIAENVDLQYIIFAAPTDIELDPLYEP